MPPRAPAKLRSIAVTELEPIVEFEPDQVFTRLGNVDRSASRWRLVGFAAMAAALLGLFTSIVVGSNPVSLQLRTTVPILLGIGALLRARSLRQTPLEVVVGATGLTVVTLRDTQHLPWETIGWAKIDALLFVSGRVLKVYDPTGRRIATLSEGLEGFDDLAELVKARVGERSPDTAANIQMAKSRRMAFLLAGFGVLATAACIFILLEALDERRADQLLAEAGVAGDAHVIRHFKAPNGRTTRIEFEIAVPTGQVATHNVEVEPAVWSTLAEGSTVSVRYVPAEPDIARLQVGQVPDEFKLSLEFTILLAIGGALLSLFMFVAAILAWKGLDIDLDSKTLKFSIKRFGAGR